MYVSSISDRNGLKFTTISRTSHPRIPRPVQRQTDHKDAKTELMLTTGWSHTINRPGVMELTEQKGVVVKIQACLQVSK